MSKIDSVLKSRDITFPTKAGIVKAMVFPVVMYRRESWTIKKAESQRIDAFALWCWRRLLSVHWTARVYISTPISQFIPRSPLPLGNHKFTFCNSNSISVL